MNKGAVIALIGVLIVFALLIPAYWAVSNGYPDGLEKLLQQQNVKEKEPVYSPPLSALQGYGPTMPVYIISGTVGGLVVFAVLILAGKALKRGNVR